MAKPARGRTIYTPKDTFVADYNGAPTTFKRGRTFVHGDHELLKLFPTMFTELRVHYDVEQATAEPGEARGAA